MFDFLIPLVICVAIMLPLSRLAVAIDLVDKPDARKRHQNKTPLIGGIAVFLSSLAYLVPAAPSSQTFILLAIGFVLVVLGSIDDKLDLNAGLRLAIQAGAALAMIFWGGNQIFTVGNILFSDAVVMNTTASIIFTVVCTVGVINSINMIDGVDGLAGSTTLISFLALAFVAYQGGYASSLQILLCVSGAIVGFLVFNARLFYPSAKVFFGDAGSMFIGLMLLWFCIDLTQQADAPLSAVAAGWIFGLPLIDTVSVMVGRIVKGKSPFAAGRDHLHHQLIDSGVGINSTVKFMAAVHALIVIIGLTFNSMKASEPFLFWIFVLIVVLHHFITPRLLAKRASNNAIAR